MSDIPRQDIEAQVFYCIDVGVSYSNEAIKRGLVSYIDEIKIIKTELSMLDNSQLITLKDREWSFEVIKILDKVDDLFKILRLHSFSKLPSHDQENGSFFLVTEADMRRLVEVSEAVELLRLQVQQYKIPVIIPKHNRKLLYITFNAFAALIFILNGDLTSTFIRLSLLLIIVISYFLILSFIFERRRYNG